MSLENIVNKLKSLQRYYHEVSQEDNEEFPVKDKYGDYVLWDDIESLINEINQSGEK